MMLQGGVYKLVDKDGNVDKKRVLKAKHRYALLAKVLLGHTSPRIWLQCCAFSSCFAPGAANCTSDGICKTVQKLSDQHGAWAGQA